MNVDRFSSACNSLETGFNILECVPIVGGFTSAVRTKLGAMQAVAGLVCMVVAGIGIFASNCLRDQEAKRKFEAVGRFGAEHTLHGALNMIRGATVVFISACTSGIGNVVMLAPNMAKDEMFTPFFKYGEFTEKRRTVDYL
ncbi:MULTISPECIES: hypothetical protein [Parachlamydia]|jgi:hypothetical protein|uniref:Uncharacterized protein n=1 Tax=Parachlamydia acanthamoebae TaxID=83552 RepID=A0A0C1EHW0_9BACT|nr:hypothetical protein [Parachlamydia acanthamoebae]KIA76214.1 hypothetical protein DB43_AQ00200 [Parachlamydia acanthamoebae]